MRITIVIEQINREMENALLLKNELTNRGHKVRILYRWENVSLFPCDLLIIPNCYHTEQYEEYRYRFNCPSGRIIDLQSEQVLANDDYESNALTPRGRALLAKHICWSTDYYNFLITQKVPSRKLNVCGPIQMDLLRTEFKGFWRSKDSLAKEFSLTKKKKWILYISSFSIAFNELIYQKSISFLGEEFTKSYRENSEKSERMTIKWFDKLLSQGKDYIIIYRPHPDEIESDIIKEIEKKYPESFKRINQYGMKQWIMSCDIITTWVSTAIAECYFAGKNTLILRPVPIPEMIDNSIYKGCHAINSVDEFIKEIENYDNLPFPINANIIYKMFNFDNKAAYLKICDLIESMETENDEDTYEKEFIMHRIKYLLKRHSILTTVIKKIYRKLNFRFGFRINNNKIRNKYFLDDWEKKASLQEVNRKYIQKIDLKIKTLLEGIKSG